MVHDAATTGYSRNVEQYNQGRPTYHPAVAQRLAARYGPGVTVELGAGTGIFTRQLVEQGLQVVAVEPLVSMRAALSANVPEADVRLGAAEDIPMADDTADTVIASQSFHWFKFREALDEIYRVLKPGGHLVTVWNVRDASVGWVGACANVIERYAGDTPRHRDMGWRRAINTDTRFGSVDEWRIDNPFPTTPDGVVARVLSTSFVGALPDPIQDQVAGEIQRIVEPLGAHFDFPYTSQLQAWRALTPEEQEG